MPADAIACINTIGRQQRMPESLAFKDRYGLPPSNMDDETDDDDD